MSDAANKVLNEPWSSAIAYCEAAQKVMQMPSLPEASKLLNLLLEACVIPQVQCILHSNLGAVEKSMKHFPLAISHLEQAVELEGGISKAEPTTLLNLSAVYTAASVFDKATTTAKAALKRVKECPKTPVAVRAFAYFNLSGALEGLKDLEGAAEAYRSAVDVDPADNSGNKREALNAFKQVRLNVALEAAKSPKKGAKEAAEKAAAAKKEAEQLAREEKLAGEKGGWREAERIEAEKAAVRQEPFVCRKGFA